MELAKVVIIIGKCYVEIIIKINRLLGFYSFFNRGIDLKTIMLLAALMMSGVCISQDNKVINAVKAQPDIAAYIKQALETPTNQVIFHQMPLDSLCGFAGCESRVLVNVMVSSNSSNAPVTSKLVIVSYMDLNDDLVPKVQLTFLK